MFILLIIAFEIVNSSKELFMFLGAREIWKTLNGVCFYKC